MKNLFLILFCIASLAIQAQDEQEQREPGKVELGLNLQSDYAAFWPKLSLNYYRNERNILHFNVTGAFSNVGVLGEVHFWNEYRNYIGKNKKWFLSHGLALRTGYSTFDYSATGKEEYNSSGWKLGIGYHFGAGYKINNHLNLTTTVMPNIYFDQRGTDRQFRFHEAISFGVNYRF